MDDVETPADQVPGVTTVIDTANATPQVVKLVAAYFNDKARRDVDASAANFSEDPFIYVEATLGALFPTREALRGLLAQGLPDLAGRRELLPDPRHRGREQRHRVLHERPGHLFPGRPARGQRRQLRRRQGFPLDRLLGRQPHRGRPVAGLKQPDDNFPADFGESLVGEGRRTGSSRQRRT